MGMGNTILSDDGIGIYVAREVDKLLSDYDVTLKEASLGGLELLELIKGFDHLILIDAVFTGKNEVGTLIRYRVEDLKGGSAMARHQVSFSEALELGRKINMDLPEKIDIFGIEVVDVFTFGESCTPEVEAKIPQIAQDIVDACSASLVLKGNSGDMQS